MQSGPILARREDLALRQRRGETSRKGNDRQFGRRIHRDRRPGIRTGGERAAHRPARVSPRRPDRLAPECVQAFAQPKAGGTFDAVGSGILPPREGERPILDRHRISFERRPETVAACRHSGGRRLHPLLDVAGPNLAVPMPDRTAADKFDSCDRLRRDYPPRKPIARVTPAAPKAMATLDKARADSRLLTAPQSHGVPLRSRCPPRIAARGAGAA